MLDAQILLPTSCQLLSHAMGLGPVGGEEYHHRYSNLRNRVSMMSCVLRLYRHMTLDTNSISSA